jgi:thiamine pyrophosphate-dependent acetolactate synthase large subunit-like protein
LRSRPLSARRALLRGRPWQQIKEAPLLRDKPDGEIDESVSWGSDVAAQMLRRFGIRYISLNPGASYRGLHDSLVNHLGNEMPTILLCVHEDHAVGIAHGYAKATGEPMACALHSNVGLMHGMMSLYNAWCDRVPMFVVGATGPLDSAKRRPWVDWVHTSSDQGALVRDIVKFDNQPSSPQALVEAMTRAHISTRTRPHGPVYICLDAGLQETALAEPPRWPDMARFQPPAPPAPPRESLESIAQLLSESERPLILFGRGGRSKKQWQARVQLAERLGACVMTDLRTPAVFPTDHPAHVVRPMATGSSADRDLINAADLVLAFEWPDLGGVLFPPTVATPPTCKVVNIALDQALHNGAHMIFNQLPAADLFVAACPDAAVAALLAHLGPGSRPPWRGSTVRPTAIDGAQVTIPLIASALREAFDDPETVALSSVCRGWPCDLWPFHDPMAYHGKDGGGGIGAGPSLAVGVALALHEQGRHTVAVLGDGDFIMGGTALWTAVRHRIPLLVLVNNNRSYFNDELHQETIARQRGRPAENRWIGQRISDPDIDLAKFAEMQGAVGIGPVDTPEGVKPAIEKGVAVLKAGGVCVIDFHVRPGAERAAHTTGQRKS